MSEHTPGPWKIIPTNQGTFIEGNVDKPIGYLAQVRPVHPDGNRVMEEANARLIAAAPDTLEACITAMEMIHMRQYTAASDVLEDAIAKATQEAK